jgi:Ser/Thr protein kinase RdoA (MazF antagonist)
MKKNIDPTNLLPILTEHFGIEHMDDLTKVAGGFRCHNVSFDDRGITYFLKQYREIVHNTVAQVKRAEQMFHDEGIPIILPLKTVKGDPAFLNDGLWYSLFPFVYRVQTSASDLGVEHVTELGIMHARLHRIGKRTDFFMFSPFGFWNTTAFMSEAREVLEYCRSMTFSTDEQRMAFENIRRQKEFVDRFGQSPDFFSLPNDHLLHGDFIYTNVFFSDDGRVEWVYDVERAGMGPRAYDLARSIFITCFDDGWHEKNYEFARTYLKAYQCHYPIGRDELAQGMRMYIMHFMHMSWMERKVLLEGSFEHERLVVRAYDRMRHFLHDPETIINDIFVE